jgi:hypothetical protein
MHQLNGNQTNCKEQTSIGDRNMNTKDGAQNYDKEGENYGEKTFKSDVDSAISPSNRCQQTIR